ncbi:putative bifunctional diguanylate cyclase/phosphodiesterase [Nitrosomonas marina]|uniref:PAS domain S-box-containing protein/diguanylate cyclase (GGDEF) domain-containing protein n=1 Tax=Nitrosomonas marina TaxID=917 RepID=A0A1H8E5J8_9PROT|nr:bifunctional diguanylate cyclase/phosphodiesterase [Nitrosomonas marina]SEN14404.1 PAS domain S-box-containing protein/diguanylate cyclase (GGDEF) domain-containing protein [Nitrosomonas marina]
MKQSKFFTRMAKKDFRSIQEALMIAFIYLIVGVMWFHSSDLFVHKILIDPGEFALLGKYKELLFVVCSALFFFVISYRLLYARYSDHKKHIDSLSNQKRLEESLKNTETILERTVKVANIGRWGFDVQSMIGTWSEEVALIYDLEPSKITPVQVGLEVFSGDDKIRIERALQEAIEYGKSYLLELEMITHKGNRKWVRTLGIPIIRNGKTERVEGVIQDVTEQKLINLELIQHEALLNSIVESSPDAIFAKDVEGRYILINHCAADLFGMPANKIIGFTDADVILPKPASKLFERDRSIVESRRIQSDEESLFLENGEEKIFLTTKGPLYTENGNLFGIFSIARDITEYKRHEANILSAKKNLDKLAHVDNLTSLPNRLSLKKQLVTKCSLNESFAFFFLDLDEFKIVNDSYGHRFGDELLVKIAGILRKTFPLDAYIARTGGDEFAIILDSFISKAHISSYIERIRVLLRQPIRIESIDVYVTVSIGIAIYPEDANTPEELFQNADTAMFDAKKQEKNAYSFYQSEFTQAVQHKVMITSDLKKALDNHILSVHYQPQIDGASAELIGFEALVRWITPDKVVHPGQFIPVAEETGLIIEVGEFVLYQGCKAAVDLNSRGLLSNRKIAINVSSRQLNHLLFLDRLEHILTETECKPAWIELEITESSICGNHNHVINLLNILKKRGFYISIDDFGTGYSSLTYLKNLPVDKLKIDQSFVRNITNEPKNQTIVRTIVSLAQGLGMVSLAEGVETEDEFLFLRESGVNSMQGYYLGRPMPEESATSLLIERICH